MAQLTLDDTGRIHVTLDPFVSKSNFERESLYSTIITEFHGMVGAIFDSRIVLFLLFDPFFPRIV